MLVAGSLHQDSHPIVTSLLHGTKTLTVGFYMNLGSSLEHGLRLSSCFYRKVDVWVPLVIPKSRVLIRVGLCTNLKLLMAWSRAFRTRKKWYFVAKQEGNYRKASV